MRSRLAWLHECKRNPVVVSLLTALTAFPMVYAAGFSQDATPVATEPFVASPGLAETHGQIIIDGSSTVWPVTVEVEEQFRLLAPNVRVEVEISGTGGGFRRFCAGGSDFQDASRKINEAEIAECAKNGVQYHELLLGLDGVTVVVNPQNSFAQCLTVEHLQRLWVPDSAVRTWRDLNPAWPDDAIDLYGPGPDSGTFDFFTEAIVGETDASRVDYTPSENDAVLVDGVADNESALGYFGYAYFAEAETDGRLRALGIDAGDGCVLPSPETIADGSYAPLSRPLFIYVNDAGLDKPEVREFARFYAAMARDAVIAVGYVPVEAANYTAIQTLIEQATETRGATPAP